MRVPLVTGDALLVARSWLIGERGCCRDADGSNNKRGRDESPCTPRHFHSYSSRTCGPMPRVDDGSVSLAAHTFNGHSELARRAVHQTSQHRRDWAGGEVTPDEMLWVCRRFIDDIAAHCISQETYRVEADDSVVG
jgi:hypothetical protein